jgi:hypothetical protein
LVQFLLCSHCGKEGHLKWQCLYKTSDEEMNLARNDEQDKHEGKKEGEEEPEEEHFMSAQASFDNSSADKGADEDEDEPEDFDEQKQDDRFGEDMKDNVSKDDDME